MNRKYIFFILIATIYLFKAEVVLGGAEYILKCRNTGCNYSTNIDFGGGLAFNQIMGYCVKCGEFVNINWSVREGEPNIPPDPVAQIWDLNSQDPIKLYKCPKCSQPFFPIKNIENIKYCPRCKQLSLKVEETGLLYD